MKLVNKIIINAPAEKVWKVAAEDFDKVGEWLSQVNHSYKREGESCEGSPMSGRICDLSEKANGPIADEKITEFNKKELRLGIHVVPKNGNIPVKENNVLAEFVVKGPNKTEVIWNSNLSLKAAGKVLYPVLKLGINKAFNELLEELKFFVENGTPHPRKLATLKKAS